MHILVPECRGITKYLATPIKAILIAIAHSIKVRHAGL